MRFQRAPQYVVLLLQTPLGVAISPIFYILENTIGKGWSISACHGDIVCVVL